MSFRKVIPLVFIFILLTTLSGFGQTARDVGRFYSQGQNLFNQYRFEEAIIKFLDAADIHERLGIGGKEDLSYDYNMIAICYSYLAQFDKAIEYYGQALVINEELGLQANIAIISNSLGDAYKFWGNYDKPMEYYEQALAINEELGKQSEVVTNLNNIGMIYFSWGHYDKAIEYMERTLVINEELEDKVMVARALNNIGAVYDSWGHYDKALENYEQALAIASELDLKEFIGPYLFNIGGVYYSRGQYDKAIENYERALAIDEELGVIANISTYLNGIGAVYYARDQYDKAIEYYEQALVIDEEHGKQANISIDINNIGKVYYSLDQYEKAVEYYGRSLAIASELGLQSDIAANLNNIGKVYLSWDQYDKAIEYFNDSISIIEDLRLTAPGDIRRDYLAKMIIVYQWLTSAYIKNNQLEFAFNIIELSSSKYLAEQMIERIGEETLSFQGIESYQRKIDNNSAVINYANIDRNDLAIVAATNINIYAVEVDKQSFISGIDEQYESTITRTVEGLRGLEIIQREIEDSIDETNKQKFNNIINYYRYLLSKPGSSPVEARALEEIARELYNLLIAPIEEQLEGKTELIIIPDGILSFLPFETLIMPDGRYLIEQYHIKYTQSLTVSELIANRDYSDDRKPMIAFGGAVYDEVSYETDMIQSVKQLEYLEQQILVALNDGVSTRSAYDELGFSNWNNLPGTLTEVIAINSIIPYSTTLTGSDVSEYNIKQLSDNGTLRNYKVLHFATHGLVVPEIPELSAVVLSLFENEQNNEDGYLTMKEIAMLDINADFVNLSACETGLGKIYGGEGIVGLTQSFLIAGANGLSVSLWQVADESTMQFMIGMYELVEEQGYSYDEANTEMKRRFINRTNDNGLDYSKPFYWAPFVYYGE